MKRVYADSEYESKYFDDALDGYAGLDLYETSGGITFLKAKIVFWDTQGQFFVETFRGEIPLEILEDLVKEARFRINVS